MNPYKKVSNLFLILLVICLYGSAVFAKEKEDKYAMSLLNEDGQIYQVHINLNTRHADSRLISPEKEVELKTLSPQNSIHSFKFKGENLVSLTGAGIKSYQDIRKVDLKDLSKPWIPPSYLKENHNWLYRFRELKGKPVFLVGDTLFIGSVKDIKTGNYRVIGRNDFGNGSILYYLAHFNKKRLERLDLSNGHIINNIKGNNYDTFNVTHWNYNKSKATILVFRKGKSTGWKLDLLKLKTFMTFYGGLLEPGDIPRLKNGSGDGYLFKPYSGFGFKLVNRKWGSEEIYSERGYRLLDTNYLGTPKPLQLNIARLDGKKAENINIGEKEEKVSWLETVDNSRFQKISLQIAQYKKPDPIHISFDYPVSRQVTVIKMVAKGLTFRVITRSNEFGEIYPERPIFDATSLNSPLHMSILNQNIEETESLISQKSYVNSENIDKNTPLHIAAYKGYLDSAKVLIARGASVYYRNETGSTPLHYAAISGKEQMIKLLLEKGKKEENEFGIGINVQNKLGQTPLHFAAFYKNGNTVKQLLALGVIPNPRDINGYGPADYANQKLVYSIERKRKEYLIGMANLLLKYMVYKAKNFEIQQDSSLKASVSKVRFYESDYNLTPYKQRKYRPYFSASETRYIAWEIFFTYPKVKEKIDFTIHTVWKRKDHTVFNKHKKSSFFKTGWTESWHTSSYGSKDSGYWRPGVYTIEYFIGKTRIAEGSFMVY